MKKAKLIFPCKIDWDSMQAHEKGKYCQECRKAVEDYTKRNLDKVNSVQFCGRFSSEQLEFNRSYYETRNYAPLTLSLLALLGAAGNAQTPAETKTDSSSVSAPLKFSNLKFPLKLEGTLRNKETRQTLANAEVSLIQNDTVIYSTKTDPSGKFGFLLLEKDIRETDFDIRVSYSDSVACTVSDTVFQLPLSADTVRANAVFALEFMVKPAELFAPVNPATFTISPFPGTIGGTIMLVEPIKLFIPNFILSGVVATNPAGEGVAQLLPVEKPREESFKLGPTVYDVSKVKNKRSFEIPDPLRRPLLIALIAFLVAAFFRFKKTES